MSLRPCTVVSRFAALLLGGILLAGCSPRDDLPGLLETREIAEQGLIYGVPIVTNYAITYGATDPQSATFRAPYNQLLNTRQLLTWESRTIVTPNSDTLYSTAWLDLRAEPIVLTVPQVPDGRYYSVQLIDASTNNYGIFGSRATGNGPGDFLVVGPDWQGETPAGIREVYRCGSQFSFALFRTQLFNPADIDNVIRVQDGYRVRPLSAYLQQPAAAAAPKVDFPAIDRDLAKQKFFEYLDFALQFIPPSPWEKDIRSQLARIGVGPDKRFAFTELPWLHRLAVLWGMKRGSDRLEASLKATGNQVNGWHIGQLAGGSIADYQDNWLLRAQVTKAGIYALDSLEAMYPLTRSLADGTPLDTGKHRYSLTFKVGELPPVNAFWSVTLYDSESQYLVKNPINRYLINSPMLPQLKKNADGSITLYIQQDSPGPARESNWLPGPDGPIYLVMRLYWPKTTAPSIFPAGHGSWQPPALQLEQ
ncbi:DUF1254 domain-containing protein [Pseudomonas sp. N040]|uniref:DUF1254 domain-containing protein n=1 Tax=Pseudomonas sp. N040 TaxID=2785325 RepID=UPI0018A25C4D|nr:DUF1254 domain-containing protein [Pseudomonas sp. N040]MBF7730554.1 DUF1254 domain-containing protein [Pseudomonas sp. N040]MBW7014198.1 DUF1254 domain-containing protein [Pseudomonas sp. N040]